MNTLQRLLSNTALAFLSNLIVKASNSLLFIFIGRLLGPNDAGAYNLGITYFTITFGLSAWGLHELLVREVAPKREESGRYLVNYLLIRLLFASMTYGLLLLALHSLLPYHAATKTIIQILALAVFPEAIFSLCQALFEAHERLLIPLIAAAVNSIIKLSVGLWLLNQSAPVTQIAWIVPIGSAISLIIFVPTLIKLLRQIPKRVSSAVNLLFIHQQFRQIPSFFVIHLFSLLDYQTDTFLISLLFSETEIGWYGAAQTIMLAFWMMPVAVRAALYPLMARYHQQASDKLAALYEKSTTYLIIIALPIATGITILAPALIHLIFNSDFDPAIPALRWSIWAVVFALLTVPNARLMLVYKRQKAASWLTGISMISNIGFNLWLIPRFGVVGAAMARLLSSFIFFSVIFLYVQKYILRLNLIRLLPRPALATILMGGVVWQLHDSPLILSISIGIFVYAVASFLLGVIPVQDWVYWQYLYRSRK